MANPLMIPLKDDEKEMLLAVKTNLFLRDKFRILKDDPDAILVVSEMVITAKNYDRMLDAIKELRDNCHDIVDRFCCQDIVDKRSLRIE